MLAWQRCISSVLSIRYLTEITISANITISIIIHSKDSGGDSVKMYEIEIDEEVYNLLKKKAEPFVDINPNSVLRRLLLNNSKTNKGDKPNVLPEFPASVPHALAETLEMIVLVKKEGFNRVEATHKVADSRGISTQAVLDKYCRQLDKRACQVDELLTTVNLDEFKALLIVRYPYHKAIIEGIFDDLPA